MTGIIKRNIQALQSNLKANLSYIDLNFKGPEDKDNFIVKDGAAIVNAYKLWLLSDLGDYCRKPTVGGFFRNNLNRYPFKQESADDIIADLKTQSEQVFPFIEVVYCEITCNFSQRCWIIKLVIKDKITGMIGDMRSNGVVIQAENIA